MVGWVRLAMGDDQVGWGLGGGCGQAVEGRGELGEIGGAGQQDGGARVRERPAVPRATGVEKEGGQIVLTGEAGDMPGRRPRTAGVA